MVRYKYGALSVDLEKQMLKYPSPFTSVIKLFVYGSIFWGIILFAIYYTL
jgi:hypothetical protein